MQVTQCLPRETGTALNTYRDQLCPATAEFENLQRAGVFDQLADKIGDKRLRTDQKVYRDAIFDE